MYIYVISDPKEFIFLPFAGFTLDPTSHDVLQSESKILFRDDDRKQNLVFWLLAMHMMYIGSSVNPVIDPKEFIFLYLIKRNLRMRNQCE